MNLEGGGEGVVPLRIHRLMWKRIARRGYIIIIIARKARAPYI